METPAEIQKLIQYHLSEVAALSARLAAQVPVVTPPVVVAPAYPAVAYFEYSARAGYESRAVGWELQVLTLEDKWLTVGRTEKSTSKTKTRFTVPIPMQNKGWQAVPQPHSYGNLRIEAFDAAGNKLTGEQFGDKTNHADNPGWTVDKALSGKFSDMYDAPVHKPSPFGYLLAAKTTTPTTTPVPVPAAPFVATNVATRQARIEITSVPNPKSDG